ncbi:chloride channel protein [Geminicoccus flavidas]|uniref:chloride channel protein n=1 Tax=Geminicoccus flavidas TaxID=2506407 RepID=UPI00135B4309|nr:chloride channel protein [Geminicoccus flavidas]
MATGLTGWRRRVRRQLFLWPRWRQQAVFWGGGALIGVVAVVFAKLADGSHRLLQVMTGWSPWVMLAVAPLGFALLAFVTERFFQGSQGSGIPQAIAARQIDSPARRQQLLALRLALGKIGLTLLGIASGASIGREGPTVQVGASIMHELGRTGGRRYEGLLLAGGAAAIAAAFNTPIAGVVFAIEELGRSFQQRNSWLVFSCVIVAGLVSLALLGDYTYFGQSNAAPAGAATWLAVGVCGLIGGLLGGGFSRLVILFALDERRAWLVGLRRHQVAFAAMCGLLVAVLGLLTGGATYGTGYEQARGLLEGTADPGFWYGPAKLAATLLSTVSGLPGGIFSPSLSVGAGIGQQLSLLFPTVPPATIVLIGMTGYFAGVVQAPLTTVVIVLEMTAGTAMTVPLMTTAILALGASRLVCPQPIYHALSRRYLSNAAERNT